MIRLVSRRVGARWPDTDAHLQIYRLMDIAWTFNSFTGDLICALIRQQAEQNSLQSIRLQNL